MFYFWTIHMLNFSLFYLKPLFSVKVIKSCYLCSHCFIYVYFLLVGIYLFVLSVCNFVCNNLRSIFYRIHINHSSAFYCLFFFFCLLHRWLYDLLMLIWSFCNYLIHGNNCVDNASDSRYLLCSTCNRHQDQSGHKGH